MTVRTDTGPFVIVPEWLLDAGVSGRALKAYCVLAKHADKNATCTPSRQRIGDLMGGASKDTVDRALEELRKLGAVSWIQRKTSDGDLTSSSYTIRRVRPGGGDSAGTGGGTDAAENQTQVEPEKRVRATSADFDRFWAVYPRRVDKGHALKAWPKAVKAAQGDVERIIRGAERYRDDPHRDPDPRFTAYPASWLNGQRWDDDPPPFTPKANGHQPTPEPVFARLLPSGVRWELDENGIARKVDG